MKNRLNCAVESRFQILRLLNSSTFYSEPFREARTPLNTFILFFSNTDITHCSAHFALGNGMQWTWYGGWHLVATIDSFFMPFS